MKKTMPKLKRQRKRKLDSTLNKSVSTYGRIPIRIISPNINWMKATEEGEKSRCSTAKGLFSDSDGSVIINSSMVPKNQEYETRPKKLKRSFPKRSNQAKKNKKLQKENVQVKNAAVSVAIAKENEPNNELSNDTGKNKCIKHSSLADSPHYPLLNSCQVKNINVTRRRKKTKSNFKITDGLSTFTFNEDLPEANETLACFQNSVIQGYDDFNENLDLSDHVKDFRLVQNKIQSTPLERKPSHTPRTIAQTRLEAKSFLFPPLQGSYLKTSTPAFLNRTRLQSKINIHASPMLKESQQLDFSFEDEDSFIKNEVDSTSLSTSRSRVLSQCQQTEPCPFASIIPVGSHCIKLGEGVYGEVFRCVTTSGQSVAVKVIPIEGSFHVNGEKQKTFNEVLPEIVNSTELSDLSHGTHFNRGFIKLFRVHCAIGRYPDELLKAWDAFSKKKTSENDRPDCFDERQHYIVFEFNDGGMDLEHFKFRNAAQALSVVQQVVAALALAEKALMFEHRDLHWGNILIQSSSEAKMQVEVNGVQRDIALHGIQTHIIDFTLSRMTKGKVSLFQDLSNDPDLFKGDSSIDYQFEIYRMIKKELDNDWSQFKPKTNIFWIHYLLDKFIFHVSYKYKRSKLHSNSLKLLKTLHRTVLKYDSCLNFYTSSSLFKNE